MATVLEIHGNLTRHG